MSNTLYWHDYETSGIDPRRDRPLQFAGIRTDEDLNEIGEPLNLYAKPAPDLLPHPEACLITGISPQRALSEGVIEAEFIRRVHAELSRPGTCGVGYNTLRFDDEFSRYTLYRNFYDPYAREWREGNSRWDIIDMLRCCHDLRPEGIEWPRDENGRPSFRLERFTAANGIEQQGAHDALVDVRATIAVARLIKEKKPRLYDYLYALRDKRKVTEQIDIARMKPLLHTSGMYTSEHGCTTVIAPLAQHPSNRNSIIVVDLRADPTPLLELGSEVLRERLYTRRSELPEGVAPIPLKQLHINKCPVIAPAKTLDEAAAERINIDIDACLRHHALLADSPGLAEKVRAIFADNPYAGESRDVDAALYDGFLGDADRAKCDEVREATPAQLAELTWRFDDERLPELLFRYRARNWPESLSEDEREQWEEYRYQRLAEVDGGGALTLDDYFETIERLRGERDDDPRAQALLDELEENGHSLMV